MLLSEAPSHSCCCFDNRLTFGYIPIINIRVGNMLLFVTPKIILLRIDLFLRGSEFCWTFLGIEIISAWLFTTKNQSMYLVSVALMWQVIEVVNSLCGCGWPFSLDSAVQLETISSEYYRYQELFGWQVIHCVLIQQRVSNTYKNIATWVSGIGYNWPLPQYVLCALRNNHPCQKHVCNIFAL